MVSAASCELSVKENIANSVLRIHLSGADAAEFNVAFRGDMRPNHAAANIGDRNLAAHCFQIHGGIDRNLECEIHVADIAASAIVGPDVNNQGIAGLPRRKISLRRFKRSRKLDLVAVPGLDRDSAGNILQLDTNIFSCRVSFRQTLLRIDAAQAERAKSEQGCEQYTSRIKTG